ncbi:hypothetical protein GCM10029964_125700 [Kibdelosporangium lantanae]
MVDTAPTPDERPAALWELLKNQTRALRNLRTGLAAALTVDVNIGDTELVYMAGNYRMWRDEAARLAMAYSARVLAPQGYPVEMISFGYLHGDVPDAERVVDVRDTLRDPAAARHILDLTGHNNKVRTVVWNTPALRTWYVSWPSTPPKWPPTSRAGSRSDARAAVTGRSPWPTSSRKRCGTTASPPWCATGTCTAPACCTRVEVTSDDQSERAAALECTGRDRLRGRDGVDPAHAGGHVGVRLARRGRRATGGRGRHRPHGGPGRTAPTPGVDEHERGSAVMTDTTYTHPLTCPLWTTPNQDLTGQTCTCGGEH